MVIIYKNKQWMRLGTFHPGGTRLTGELITRIKTILREQQKILDLGCGTGDSVALLQAEGYETIGIDNSQHLINIGRKKYSKHRLLHASAESLPFEENEFDGILCECVLSEINWKTAAPEIIRVLKPRGCLFVTDIYLKNQQAAGLGLPWWKETLAGCGFEEVEWEDKTSYLRELISEWIWKYESTEIPLLNCHFRGEDYHQLGYFLGVYRRG